MDQNALGRETMDDPAAQVRELAELRREVQELRATLSRLRVNGAPIREKLGGAWPDVGKPPAVMPSRIPQRSRAERTRNMIRPRRPGSWPQRQAKGA